MKKTLIVTAIAFSLALSTLNAETPIIENNPNFELAIQAGKVNAFCLSIVKGDLETVQKLINLGVDVNEKSNGKTPLHYAAKYNKVDIARLLVKHGAKINAKCDKGYTVKKYAKIASAKETLRFLDELKTKKKSKSKV